MPTVRLDASRLHDWDSFHTVFASTFGFPDFYGRNMNAWIDCMTDLSEDTGMTTVRGSTTDSVVLYLDNINAVPTEIYMALVECSAFVNWRRLELGSPAVLILAFHRAG
jgi:RNAse (barnase) inhibitor barstar